MLEKKYVIGVDFGTLSARAVVLDVTSGSVVSESTSHYAHKVMDKVFLNGEKLPDGFALQHPRDYLDSLAESVVGAVKASGAHKEEIGGIGVDFTASTVLPIYEDGTPLAFDECFGVEPHAYAKLWKHHGAQNEADDFTRVARERGEAWLGVYGGTVSSELMLPKILETARKAPSVYEKAWRFVEAGDWINMILTGVESHAAAFAGYKAFWGEGRGFPSNDYFKAVDPLLDGVIGTKVSENISDISKKAGALSRKGAALLGLLEGTPVALAMIDAHAAMPAVGAIDKGSLMMILGTSACYIVNSDEEKTVDGIFGYAKNAVIDGKVTYEAGQACFGDVFDWYSKNCIPEAYTAEARKTGVSILEYITQKAEGLEAGENSLIALDWFNGNRSVLLNSRLSGMILGLTLTTTPEEIYRALMESVSFGARRIIEQFESYGIEVSSIIASGGIAGKNTLLMQIMSDVLGREIRVADTTQAGALGSAIYAAAAGGFFEDVTSASKALSVNVSRVYSPKEENKKVYDKLYAEYLQLHDYFGRENAVMSRLK